MKLKKRTVLAEPVPVRIEWVDSYADWDESAQLGDTARFGRTARAYDFGLLIEIRRDKKEVVLAMTHYPDEKQVARSNAFPLGMVRRIVRYEATGDVLYEAHEPKKPAHRPQVDAASIREESGGAPPRARRARGEGNSGGDAPAEEKRQPADAAQEDAGSDG